MNQSGRDCSMRCLLFSTKGHAPHRKFQLRAVTQRIKFPMSFTVFAAFDKAETYCDVLSPTGTSAFSLCALLVSHGETSKLPKMLFVGYEAASK